MFHSKCDSNHFKYWQPIRANWKFDQSDLIILVLQCNADQNTCYTLYHCDNTLTLTPPFFFLLFPGQNIRNKQAVIFDFFRVFLGLSGTTTKTGLNDLNTSKTGLFFSKFAIFRGIIIFRKIGVFRRIVVLRTILVFRGIVIFPRIVIFREIAFFR